MASSSSTKPVNFELAKTTDRANLQKKSKQQEKDDWEKFKAWQNLNKQDEIVHHLQTIALKMGTHEIRSGEHKPDPKQSSRAIQAINKCPFNITNKNNPCNSTECDNTNWTDTKYNPNCLSTIKSYCKETNDTYCSTIKTKKTCSSSSKILNSLDKSKQKDLDNYEKKNVDNKSFEKNISNNNFKQKDLDNKSFEKNISNNNKIDMSKYIRKDKIPCWGCNLK